MNKNKEEIYVAFILSLLEEYDDVFFEFNEQSVKKGNFIMKKISKYFVRFPHTNEFWDQLTPLLSHPRKMVRVCIATEMLKDGRKEAWPVFITDLWPHPNRAQFPRELRNREFSAESFASTFILMNYQFLDALDVTPSLSELEDQWIAEGRRTRRFPRLS
jgi:hypothetical protein